MRSTARLMLLSCSASPFIVIITLGTKPCTLKHIYARNSEVWFATTRPAF